MRRIAQLSNLTEAIENGMISIVGVENKTKASADITVTDQVTPDKFIESIQFLNESTLFRNSVDFYYEFVGKNGIRIEAGMKNRFLDEYFCVDCVILDGYSLDDVDAKFRENVFDELSGKIAV